VYIRIDFACPSTCPSFVVYVPQKNQILLSSAMAERDPSDITIKKNANLIWHVIIQFSGSRVKMLLRYQIFATLTKRMFSLRNYPKMISLFFTTKIDLYAARQ